MRRWARRCHLLPAIVVVLPADLTQEDHLDGTSARHSRRHHRQTHLPARWHLRNPDSAVARSQRERRRAHRSAGRRAHARREPRAAVFGETKPQSIRPTTPMRPWIAISKSGCRWLRVRTTSASRSCGRRSRSRKRSASRRWRTSTWTVTRECRSRSTRSRSRARSKRRCDGHRAENVCSCAVHLRAPRFGATRPRNAGGSVCWENACATTIVRTLARRAFRRR